MRTWMTIVLAALLAGIPAAAAAAPRIAADETAYDYGTVDETTPVERVFTLRNTGDAPLNIYNVESSCGCTTTQLGGKTILPGGSTSLTARVSLMGRRGKQDKTISITSNDPQQPMLTLRMTGTVVADIDFLPNRVDFLDMRENQTAARTVTLVNNGSTPLKVLRTESNSRAFTARLDETEKGKRWQVTVTTVPPLAPGFTRGAITLATDSPRYPTLTLPVSAQVPSDIIVVPAVLAIPDSQDRPSTSWLAVRSRSGRQFRISSVISPFPEIRTRFESVDGASWKIEVSNVTASQKLGGTALRIQVEGVPAEIRVPLQVYRSRPPAPRP